MKKKTAQTVTEYALLFAMVTAGLLGIRVYLHQGVKGGTKESVDRIGSQWCFDTASITTRQESATARKTRSGKHDVIYDDVGAETKRTLARGAWSSSINLRNWDVLDFKDDLEEVGAEIDYYTEYRRTMYVDDLGAEFSTYPGQRKGASLILEGYDVFSGSGGGSGDGDSNDEEEDDDEQ